MTRKLYNFQSRIKTISLILFSILNIDSISSQNIFKSPYLLYEPEILSVLLESNINIERAVFFDPEHIKRNRIKSIEEITTVKDVLNKSGRKQIYTYDTLGRIIEINYEYLNKKRKWATKFIYIDNWLSKIISIQDGNDSSRTIILDTFNIKYNQKGLISEIYNGYDSTRCQIHYSLTYNKNNKIAKIECLNFCFADSMTAVFKYDERYNLNLNSIMVHQNDFHETYSFIRTGNGRIKEILKLKEDYFGSQSIELLIRDYKNEKMRSQTKKVYKLGINSKPVENIKTKYKYLNTLIRKKNHRKTFEGYSVKTTYSYKFY